MLAGPSYDGGGLVNLVAELELRLTGSAPMPGLTPELAAAIPEADTYVLVLFDGLGDSQLEHDSATALADDRVGKLDAPFPTTTTVSLATVATGLVPRSHGVIGHLMWLPEVDGVVNVLKWVSTSGTRVEFETEGFLPAPNLWERLRAAGVEPITVQPGTFSTSPTTRALYRGCRFEPVFDEREMAEATITLARSHPRLIFTYLPHVDFAAHVFGQDSLEYAGALSEADSLWTHLRARLPAGVTVIGTADHGLIDYPHEDQKLLIRDPQFDELRLFGDPRAVMATGDLSLIDELVDATGSTLVEPGLDLWGNETPHPALARRMPDRVLLAPPGRLVLPRGFDKRLIGYHGGLEAAEREIPLLVATG